MKIKTLLLFTSLLTLQSVFGQFEEYSNKRMDTYFSASNHLVSLNIGQATDHNGYEISGRFDYFWKDGISTGSYLTAYINHPNFFYLSIGQNIRGYLFHFKIRPFIEINHDIIIANETLALNIGPGGGIAIAGITNMLGIELQVNYEVPYVNFNDTKITPYLMPSLGIHLQW